MDRQVLSTCTYCLSYSGAMKQCFSHSPSVMDHFQVASVHGRFCSQQAHLWLGCLLVVLFLFRQRLSPFLIFGVTFFPPGFSFDLGVKKAESEPFRITGQKLARNAMSVSQLICILERAFQTP